jgi:hypothetical protein
VRQEDHPILARRLFLLVEVAAQRGRNAQCGQQGRGPRDGAQALGRVLPRERHVHIRVGRHRGQGSRQLAIVAVLERRDRDPLQADPPEVAEDAYQPLWLREGQRPQQHPVHHAEHRAVGADAQRQRQHRRQREARTLTKDAQRVARILEEAVHIF